MYCSTVLVKIEIAASETRMPKHKRRAVAAPDSDSDAEDAPAAGPATRHASKLKAVPVTRGGRSGSASEAAPAPRGKAGKRRAASVSASSSDSEDGNDDDTGAAGADKSKAQSKMSKAAPKSEDEEEEAGSPAADVAEGSDAGDSDGSSSSSSGGGGSGGGSSSSSDSSDSDAGGDSDDDGEEGYVPPTSLFVDLTVSTLNPFLTCMLCGGYFRDAHTSVECLHTCKPRWPQCLHDEHVAALLCLIVSCVPWLPSLQGLRADSPRRKQHRLPEVRL